MAKLRVMNVVYNKYDSLTNDLRGFGVNFLEDAILDNFVILCVFVVVSNTL